MNPCRSALQAQNLFTPSQTVEVSMPVNDIRPFLLKHGFVCGMSSYENCWDMCRR